MTVARKLPRKPPRPVRIPAITAWRVTRDDRIALLRKYRTLEAWRRARDRGGADGQGAARGALRALAEEFPGALRELDLLGLPEIERRIERLERIERSTPKNKDDRWIPWILAYHALMRAALTTKRALGGMRGPSAESLPALVRGATAVAGVRLDEAFVRAVANPPSGRIAIVVLRAVARIFEAAPASLSTTLFPPRRPPPYVL